MAQIGGEEHLRSKGIEFLKGCEDERSALNSCSFRKQKFPENSANTGGPNQQQLLTTLGDENRILTQKVSALLVELSQIKGNKQLLEHELAHSVAELECEQRKHREAVEEMSFGRSQPDLEARQYRVELEKMLRQKAVLEQELEHLKHLNLRAEIITRGTFQKLESEIDGNASARRRSGGHLTGNERHQERQNEGELQNETSPEEQLSTHGQWSEQTALVQDIGQMDSDLETVQQVVKIKHIVDQMYVYIREMHCEKGAGTALVEQGIPANETENLRKLVTELNQVNDQTHKDLKGLQFEMRSLEQYMSTAEHKASLRQMELSSLSLKLEKAQSELKQMHEKDEAYQQRLAHLEDELKDSQHRSENFRLKAEALSQDCVTAGAHVQGLEEEIEVLRQDKSLAEQQVLTQKAAADYLKEKLKAAEGQKSCGEKEWEQKNRVLEDKLAKSQCMSREFEHKVNELSQACSQADDVMRSLKTESTHLRNEKALAEERVEFQKREANVLKETLKKVQEALEKKVKTEHMYQQMVRKLEDDLTLHKQTTSELKQKVDELVSVNLRADRIVSSVKSELDSVMLEKKVTEQRGDAQRVQVDCLSAQLKKTQEQLIQKVREEQEQELRAQKLEEEVDNGQRAMDDLKLQLAELTKDKLVAARTIEELQAELSAAKMEKGVLEEEVRMQCSQMQEFGNKLDQARQQLQKENNHHQNNWTIQQGSRAEQSNHIAEGLIKHEWNCQRHLEWSEVKDKKRGALEESYYLCGGMRPMMAIDELELESDLHSQQTVLAAQHTTVQRKFTAMQKEPGLMETKYDTNQIKLQEARQSTSIEERKNDAPLRSLKQPLEMTKLELSKLRGEMGKAFQDKKTVSFGNEGLKNNAKCLEAEQKDFEASEDKQDALASCCGQSVWHKHEGDFVAAGLSKISISSSTDLVSQNTPVKLHSEKYPKQNNNATFPGQVSDKYHANSNRNTLNKAQDEIVPSAKVLEFQGLRHQVTVKDLVEAELLNKNVAEQLEKGIKTVSQVQNSLGKYLNKVNSIAGLYLEASKQKISFYDAAKEGIIGSSVALGFLEAQAATGYIVHTPSNGKYSVQEAIERGLIPQEFKERLLLAEKAVTGYFHYDKTLSVFQAMENKLLAKQTGRRLLEVQIATGGIIDPVRSVRLPLETACKQGLLNTDVTQNLYKALDNMKGFQNPNNTGQAMRYAELIKLCVVDLEGNYLLLPFGSRKISTPSPVRANTISVVDTSTKSEITLYDAFLKYYIEKQTYLELSALQSQWRETTEESQGIIQYFLTDSNSGRQFSINDALTQGIISQTDLNRYRDSHITVTELADMLSSRTTVAASPNSAIAGIWDPNGCRRISVLKAMRQNLVERLTATRLLEAQACTGGITDPATGKKFSISEALQRDLIESEIAASIQKSQQAYRGFLQPGTGATLSTAEALRRNLLGRDLGHRFLELQYLTGGLVDPNLHGRISLEDALRRSLIDDQTAQRLRDEKMHARNLVCPKTKQKISYKEALARAVFDCHTGLRLLEAAEHPNALSS
ncbi:desmoplakin-like [Heterodontus francisci]|uniref:desmoplakin-like n=1 Tax=Heterodontus francisci TaxID=7792 RepID=UPI00355B29AB